MIDIAAVNLACAEGLPGSENIDRKALLAKLDRWAAYVKWQTDRHLYRLNDPKWAEAYAHSEARLRMEMIVGVLQQELGVRYNQAAVENLAYLNSAEIFIHGMLGHGEGGTCNSMPVLYVAIGRRLGYPMFLVRAKRHVFCRWDGWGERVNMDGSTSSGIGFPDDKYYHDWPEPLRAKELDSGDYLTSLTPARELAHSLYTRALCLAMHRRFPEALEAFLSAARWAPDDHLIRKHLRITESNLHLIHQSRVLSERERMLRLVEQMLPPLDGGIRHPLAKSQNATGWQPAPPWPAPNASGHRPLSVQDYLDVTNRRIQHLMRDDLLRFNRPDNRASFLAPSRRAPTNGIPSTLNFGRRSALWKPNHGGKP